MSDGSPVSSSDARPTVSAYIRAEKLVLLGAAVVFLGVFWRTLADLVSYWSRDRDFSHGFLVPVISVAILLAHRKRLGALPAARSRTGLALLLASIGVFFVGGLLYSNSLERLSLVGALAGGVWFALGTPFMTAKPFPFFFLLLSVPPPFYQMTDLRVALQQLVTRISSQILFRLGEPALAHGNVLVVGSRQFGVTDACSGIRSLMAIVTTTVLMAYLLRTGFWRGLLLVLTAIPVTIGANVLRLLAITLGHAWFGVDLSGGRPHDAIGLACFAVSLVAVFMAWKFYSWFFRWNMEANEAR